jgi:class 3 adenylate cyclase
MFTDILGYDSLLKENEKNAFEIRKKNQRIHRRLIKRFNGRWLKEMKSGILVSFSSNIDAVMCAVSIQKATEELNIPIRIGIHQGDVIFEKKDILGDGVNIASRIQSFTETHGIVISDTVYKDIRNKEGLKYKSLGTQALKGVESPVGIYNVNCPDESL